MANIIDTEYIKSLLTGLYDWMPVKRTANGHKGVVQDSKDASGNQTLTISNDGEVAFGKYNKSNQDTVFTVGTGNSSVRKNALEIRKDGSVYILTDITASSMVSLQDAINRNGVTICESYDELMEYAVVANLGKLLYLRTGSAEHPAGLYMIAFDVSTNSYKPTLVGTESNVVEDIQERVTAAEARITTLEEWLNTPISDEDLNNITQTNQ